MRALVSGLINLETTVRVDGFPLAYQPVHYPFFGVRSSVSGVGFNIALALQTLGDEARLLALIGRDRPGELVRLALHESGLPGDGVLARLEETAQSAILYDAAGRRAIHVDLKDIQETSYPQELFREQLDGSDLAVLCNINYSRPFLKQAQAAGVPIATDVHAIADLDDAYNRDFMAAADILFMSDENLPFPAETWVRELQARYKAEMIGIGMGAQGALLAVRSQGKLYHVPAVHVRPVVNTIGAGDALFSGFLHAYYSGMDAYTAMRAGVYFAGYKVGGIGAADGFLSAEGLETLMKEGHFERAGV